MWIVGGEYGVVITDRSMNILFKQPLYDYIIEYDLPQVFTLQICNGKIFVRSSSECLQFNGRDVAMCTKESNWVNVVNSQVVFSSFGWGSTFNTLNEEGQLTKLEQLKAGYILSWCGRGVNVMNENTSFIDEDWQMKTIFESEEMYCSFFQSGTAVIFNHKQKVLDFTSMKAYPADDKELDRENLL